jgi:hypothetical protein
LERNPKTLTGHQWFVFALNVLCGLAHWLLPVSLITLLAIYYKQSFRDESFSLLKTICSVPNRLTH